MPPGMTLEQMLRAMAQQQPEPEPEQELEQEPEAKPVKRSGKLSQ